MNAYQMGHKAFTRGGWRKGGLDNPFDKDSQECREWERGFNVAYFQNLEKLNGGKKKAPSVGGRGKTVSEKADSTT